MIQGVSHNRNRTNNIKYVIYLSFSFAAMFNVCTSLHIKHSSLTLDFTLWYYSISQGWNFKSYLLVFVLKNFIEQQSTVIICKSSREYQHACHFITLKVWKHTFGIKILIWNSLEKPLFYFNSQIVRVYTVSILSCTQLSVLHSVIL